MLTAADVGDEIISTINPLSNPCVPPPLALSNEQLSMLYFIYNKNLERAMRILDQQGVKLVKGIPSQRSFFLVRGESKGSDEYICFPKHFCSCHSFFYDVIIRGEQLCCKHQLAAKIANALQIYREVEISDEELALYLFEHQGMHHMNAKSQCSEVN